MDGEIVFEDANEALIHAWDELLAEIMDVKASQDVADAFEAMKHPWDMAVPPTVENPLGQSARSIIEGLRTEVSEQLDMTQRLLRRPTQQQVAELLAENQQLNNLLVSINELITLAT